jgi:hypothetical protein
MKATALRQPAQRDGPLPPTADTIASDHAP